MQKKNCVLRRLGIAVTQYVKTAVNPAKINRAWRQYWRRKSVIECIWSHLRAAYSVGSRIGCVDKQLLSRGDFFGEHFRNDIGIPYENSEFPPALPAKSVGRTIILPRRELR